MCSIPRIYIMHISLGTSFSPDSGTGFFIFLVGEGDNSFCYFGSTAEREGLAMQKWHLDTL